MDQETNRNLRRIEREIGILHKEARLLRERIAATSGDSGETYYQASVLNGTLDVGNGIVGGGTFPGTVSVSVRGQLRAGHFSMGEAHALGGDVHIAPSASLRSPLVVVA